MVRATVIEAARPRKPTEKINGQCNRKTHRAGQGGASLRHSFRGAARHADRGDERAFPGAQGRDQAARPSRRSEEHTSELQSLMRISYAVFCLQKKKNKNSTTTNQSTR